MEINVGSIMSPSFNSTNGIAMDIFLTGCTRFCKGCHNTNLWDKNAGIRISFEEIERIVKSKKVIDSIAVMGGEPLENPLLPDLLSMLSKTGKTLWLYTSFELDEIPSEIKQYCDFIKTGRFIEELYCDERLKSSNQKIFIKGEEEWRLYYERGVTYGEILGRDTMLEKQM